MTIVLRKKKRSTLSTLLSKFGAGNAHAWLPGASGVSVSGLPTDNYLLSDGTGYSSTDSVVGLVLDGLGAWEDVPQNWVKASGDGVVTAVGNTITITGATTTTQVDLSPAHPFVDGYLKAEFTVTWSSATTVRVYIAGGASVPVNGTRTTYGVSAKNSTVDRLQIDSGTATFVIHSLRLNRGIFASQATTANKPILRRGALNLQDWSENISGATGWASDGMQVGSTVTLPASSVTAFRAYKTGAITANTAYVASVYIPPAAFWSDPSASFKLTWFGLNATRTDFTPNTVNAGAGGWITCAVSAAVVSATTTLDFRLENLTASTITCSQPFKVQIEAGITAGDYTPTTTVAASNPSAGKYWWSFDGSNDSLALGSMPFQMADDHCVIAGVKQLAAANGYVFSQNNTAATTLVGAIAVTSAGVARALWSDDGGATAYLTGTAPILGTSTVVTAVKQGNAKRLRVNGVQDGATNNTAMGATTLNTASIGSFTTAGNINAQIGPVITIKGTVSDADLLALERLVGQLMGVTI